MNRSRFSILIFAHTGFFVDAHARVTDIWDKDSESLESDLKIDEIPDADEDKSNEMVIYENSKKLRAVSLNRSRPRIEAYLK